MSKQSAGILLYRRLNETVEVLLVHPGGPFWAKKDLGSWSIPKGELHDGEDTLAAAKREFAEEVGANAPAGAYRPLEPAKQASGKVVHAFALESDFNLEHFSSNMFDMEWPPKSGVTQEFPENDKAAWTPIAVAAQKLVKGQVPLVEQLAHQLGVPLEEPVSGPDSPQTSLF